jgi:hypothetical protein
MHTVSTVPPALLSAAVILWSGSAGLADSSADPYRFQLHQGFLIVVQGSLSGASLDLLLDTGTPTTILDRTVVRHIGSPRVVTRIRAVGRTLAAERVELPELTWPGGTSRQLTVLAADLGGLARRTGVEVDGILGLDVLRGHCISIDYRAKRIGLAPGKLAGSRTTVPLERVDGLVTAPARIGARRLRLAVDTGANSIVLFRAASPGTMLGPSGTVAGAGAIDEVPVRVTVPEFLLIGPAHLVDRPVLISAAPPLSASLDGLLGVTALAATRVQLDLRGMTLSW